MASYSSFTKTGSPVLGICILTLTTLYRQSFSLMHSRSIPLWSLACRWLRGQYMDTILRVRHGENVLNEYSLLVRHWLIYEEAISRQPSLTRKSGPHLRG